MLFDSANVEISRIAYHSEGLISSEEATEPRRYMRVLSGQVPFDEQTMLASHSGEAARETVAA